MFDDLEQLPKPVDSLFKQMGDDVIKDILSRLEKVQEIIPSTDYQLWRLTQLGEHKSYIKKRLKELLKLSNEEIDKLYKETIKEGYVRDKTIYDKVGVDFIPYEENESLQMLIQACEEQTKGDFKNITQTMGFVINGEGIKEDAYFKNILNKAEIEIATGVFDYNTTIKQAVNQMVNSGVRTINYESGHKDRIDTAVRRAVMTGVQQVVGKISEDNAKNLGTDKFEVSAHATARPTHQVWQGRVYTKQELIDICGLGEVTGLCGANCYHHYDPFIEGISVRKYTDKQLDQMNEEANKKRIFNDKEYTNYEATQRQRALERNLKGLKEKISYLKKYGGSKDDINAIKTRYNSLMEEYKEFSKKMDLPFQPERVHTTTYKNSGNLNNFQKEIGDVYDKAMDNQEIDRDSITKMFSQEKYEIGSINDKKVYVYNKDLSYFIKKHGNEMYKAEIVDISNIMDYTSMYKDINRETKEMTNIILFKKGVKDKGYLEACLKEVDEEYELFHYQYRSLKSYLKKIKKLELIEKK